MRAVVVLAVAAAAALGDPRALAAQRDLVLATTTSVRDAGLLDALLPPFERESGRRVKVVAVGSGQAMELGRRGEADIFILHDPRGEEAFVREGYGVERAPLMYNEFVLAGPPSDPAGVRSLSNAAKALVAIASAGAQFVSRGDRSGTHIKELELWRRAGIEPRGSWYLESGQGMGATLQIANELQAYVLTDIGTFLAHRYPLDLEILVSGDTALFNPYHVVLANPERFPWVDFEGARALREYLLSERAQRAIGAFGRDRFGRSLFNPALTGQPGRSR
ncbi:MAG: tungsten ABC transporter substrate-binding protein [Gemmatimonadales bacterium]|nr:MAG: tungsten ABC transporter substrate-binding protein [Gemmatimonadales bacterium]